MPIRTGPWAEPPGTIEARNAPRPTMTTSSRIGRARVIQCGCRCLTTRSSSASRLSGYATRSAWRTRAPDVTMVPRTGVSGLSSWDCAYPGDVSRGHRPLAGRGGQQQPAGVVQPGRRPGQGAAVRQLRPDLAADGVADLLVARPDAARGAARLAPGRVERPEPAQHRSQQRVPVGA